MSLVDMDSIQFYQPPVQAIRPCTEVHKASNRGVNTIVGEKRLIATPDPFNQWVVQGRSRDPENLVEASSSSPRNLLDHFERPGLEETAPGTHVGGKTDTDDLHQRVIQDDQTPSNDIGISQVRPTHGTVEHFARHLDYSTLEDCGRSIIPAFTSSGGMMDPTTLDSNDSDCAERDSDHHIVWSSYGSGKSTASGYNHKSVSSDTQVTSAAESEESHSNLYKDNVYADSNIPPTYLTGHLPLMPGGKIRKSRGADRAEADLSLISNTKGVPCGREGLESNNKENDRKEMLPDSHKETDTALLRSIKKRSLSSTRTKTCVKRRNKRHPFSSPLPYDEETEETGDESDFSNYLPDNSYARAHSCRLTGITNGTSDAGKTEAGGQVEWSRTSRTSVVYEQQIWEGEIIDEREIRQRRGRPRRQYLVRWKSSWVDGSRLAAPGLVENWKEKKASRYRG